MLYMFLLFVFCSDFKSGSAQPGCIIDITSPNTPLVLRNDLSELYYMEQVKDSFQIEPNKTVKFVCPGTSILLKGNDTGAEIIEATCLPGFNISNYYKWSEVLCKNVPKAMMKDEKQKCTYENEADLYSVGFSLNNGANITVYLVCYNPQFAVSMYTYHRIIPWRNMSFLKEHNEPETIWLNTIKDQQAFVNKLTKRDPESEHFIRIRGDRYFVKSHLVPNEDFYYPMYQNSIFEDKNFVAQFKTVRNGNWDTVEEFPRKFASEKRLSLEVWTGVYGVVELSDVKYEAVDTFNRPDIFNITDETNKDSYLLYAKDDETTQIAPAVFWKVVYHRPSKSGIALVTVGNPYNVRQTHGYRICEQLELLNGWFRKTKRGTRPDKSVDRGYSYSCHIDDFRRTVDYVPQMEVKNLLLW